MMNKFVYGLACVCMLVFGHLYADIVGSETVVSVESFYEFPATALDNCMLGFGWFKYGFGLEDATTDCTFDDIYPISGVVNMRGGALYLTQDLIFNNETDLQGCGSIYGNGHKIDLCSSIQQLPSDTTLFDNLNLYLYDDVQLTSSITIQGNCTIKGNSHTVYLGVGGFSVASGATLNLCNLVVANISDNMTCVDDTAKIVLDKVVGSFDGDMTFSTGSFEIYNYVEFRGQHTFAYESSQAIMLNHDSIWYINSNITFKIGRQSPGGDDPIIFEDRTSILRFGESQLYATDYGIQLTRGRIEFSDDVTIDAALTGSSDGIILGDGIDSNNDMEVYCGPGCDLNFRSGWFTYNNVESDRFYAASPSVRFIRLSNSYFYIATDCTFPECTFQFNITTQFPPTIVAPGVKLLYNNTRIVTPYGAAYMQGYRDDCFSCILDGNDQLLFDLGDFSLGVKIIGINNSMRGGTNIIGPLVFDNSLAQLTMAIDGFIDTDISLMGGTLSLGADLAFSRGRFFATSGTVDLLRYRLTLGSSDITCNVAMNWTATDAAIDIRSALTLTDVWTFDGDIIIDGHGNTIDLDSGGEFIILADSHLTLKDITIRKVGSNDIYCADDTGILTLDNVRWIQDADYTFSYGALEFKNELSLEGEGYAFDFATTQTSTIAAQTNLTVHGGFTFTYDPAAPSATLLEFEDSSAVLILNGGTLHVGLTGFELLHGTLEIERDATIYTEKTVDAYGNVIDEGLTLGDGIADNDAVLKMFPGAHLTILNGLLKYRNVDADSLQMSCGTNIRFMTGTMLYLYENMYLNYGSITFDADSILARWSGKQVYGSVHAGGPFSTSLLS